ncbi:MAG: 1-acyl-sn-glycerol-3-phosphate acyltransferase [Lachnospiraceae bacterium]|jgi:1-acyl-sn-glycerol-3-phosphate acyltransferase|uniref:lysophospholipid acyltransferase family protein n=1 Tax=Clostridia TaxID=186801 RepID=UPI000E47749D|nr:MULTISPECIES: lysophospholipid acyltransferase family protein [Clostridia]MBS5191044.1 1-acyl-sn-glycerol-3-phosphate acyltransferase [Lachnospiraceae bacterium]RHV72309.1 1-acyl-sn-glycerol-3-phosphate acyltransferase [Roseburia sp. OM02-15]
MLRTILAVLFAVCYLIIGIPVLFVEWLIGKKNPHLRDISSLRMVQWAFRVICRICGVKLTVKGQENVPKDIPVLYVANHNSYFDIMITYALCPDLTGYIAKDSLEKVPLLNIWMKRLYCLFLKRDDMKASLKTILQAIEYVKKGISICIFPEGTRGDSDEMAPFKEGSMKIAEKTGCPIVPMAISHTRDIIKDHMPFVKPTHVTVEYGAPIYPKELAKEERRALGRLSQNMIQEMLDAQKASEQ